MRSVSRSADLGHRTQGIAMVAALGLMSVAAMIMVVLFLRTMDEIRHGRDDAGIVQSLLLAHGGSSLGAVLLRNDARTSLDEIASSESDSTGTWSFGTSDIYGSSPTPSSVAAQLQVVASRLQADIDLVSCGERTVGPGATIEIRIYFTNQACGQALPPGTSIGAGRFVSGKRRELGGNQTYAVPFVLVSDGAQAEFRRRIVTQGEFQFEVGRRSLARYALFTDRHVAPGGAAPIWFLETTLFDGPVHTNGNFNFSRNPWFGGAVTSAGVTAGSPGPGAYALKGYSGSGVAQRDFISAPALLAGGNFPNMDRNGYSNRPQFVGGVDWRADYIALPENAHDQRALAADEGLLFTGDIEFMELAAGDANGNKIQAGQNAGFQYVTVRGTNLPGNGVHLSARTIMYRISPSGEIYQRRRNSSNNGWESGSAWTLVSSGFNGVIYADRYIPRLRGGGRTAEGDPATARPALAQFSQITLVPAVGARITGDLTYAAQPCQGQLSRGADGTITRADCNNLNATNVLGIFSPGGDIVFGNPVVPNSANADVTAPQNVRIQGSLLTANGVVQVENYNNSNAQNRGTVQLLGGIIEREYGGFGTLYGSGAARRQVGYGRSFTFDPRLGMGLAPPYFPTVGQDGVTDTRTFTFGHREQVF